MFFQLTHGTLLWRAANHRDGSLYCDPSYSGKSNTRRNVDMQVKKKSVPVSVFVFSSKKVLDSTHNLFCVNTTRCLPLLRENPRGQKQKQSNQPALLKLNLNSKRWSLPLCTPSNKSICKVCLLFFSCPALLGSIDFSKVIAVASFWQRARKYKTRSKTSLRICTIKCEL